MHHTKINQKYAVWITVFLSTIILEVATTEVIHNNNTIVRRPKNHCECIVYDCGCCDHIELDAISLNGTICTNVTYLEHDYGFSVTVTYNNVAIINETLSARNPPPICFGENLIPDLPARVCLRLYDININGSYFHVCFELEARFAHLNILPLHLGCFDNTKSHASSDAFKSTYMSIFIIILSCIMTS